MLLPLATARSGSNLVVAASATVAIRAPPADGAMFDRFGIWGDRRQLARVLGNECLELAPDPTFVGRVVSQPERRERPTAERKVHELGCHTLRLREEGTVERGLQHGACLGGACQLGVDHLIRSRAGDWHAVLAAQDVGAYQKVGISE